MRYRPTDIRDVRTSELTPASGALDLDGSADRPQVLAERE
jgi:hypothetical protein